MGASLTAQSWERRCFGLVHTRAALGGSRRPFGALPTLPCARRHLLESRHRGWAMPGTTEGYTRHGVLAAAISTGMVGLEHTGRGPVRARTTIDDNIIVCVL